MACAQCPLALRAASGLVPAAGRARVPGQPGISTLRAASSAAASRCAHHALRARFSVAGAPGGAAGLGQLTSARVGVHSLE